MADTPRQGKRGKKPDRRPAHQRYTLSMRWKANKRKRVTRSSHGKWTWDALVEHQHKIERERAR